MDVALSQQDLDVLVVPDSFAQAAYFWTGLHGYVALAQTIDAFPWPRAAEYVERMIELHIDVYAAGLSTAR